MSREAPVAPGGAHHRADVSRVDHLNRSGDEHAGERGERDLAHPPGRDEYGDEQEQRMEHRCQACARACPHVDGSSGDRGGCGNPAEQGRDDVGHALPEELAVGIVPVADSHCVGNRRRQ